MNILREKERAQWRRYSMSLATGNGVWPCAPKGYGSCGPTPHKSHDAGSSQPAGILACRSGRFGKRATHRCFVTKKCEPGGGSAPSASAPPALSPDLAVVQHSKGPIMTMLEEFYKIGPGPSSSHTMGPMRITYDFFQRVSKLPEDQLKRATALKVHFFGSLSATGKGHGTDRASLAGLLGKAPATCPPEFLDGLAAHPDQTYKVTIGPSTLDLSLKDSSSMLPRATSTTPTR